MGWSAAARARVVQASEATLCSRGDGGAGPGARQGRIPPTIQALLTAPAGGLAVDERELLERGAVEGDVFHRLGVRAMLDERLAAQVEPRLADLVRKDLIRPYPAIAER